jgi:hypothetical protein
MDNEQHFTALKFCNIIFYNFNNAQTEDLRGKFCAKSLDLRIV